MLDALKEGGWWISRELFYVIRKRMRNGVRKERKEGKEDEERIIELQLKGMQKWARDKREIERRDGMWRSLTHCVILGWDPMTKWKESERR